MSYQYLSIVHYYLSCSLLKTSGCVHSDGSTAGPRLATSKWCSVARHSLWRSGRTTSSLIGETISMNMYEWIWTKSLEPCHSEFSTNTNFETACAFLHVSLKPLSLARLRPTDVSAPVAKEKTLQSSADSPIPKVFFSKHIRQYAMI